MGTHYKNFNELSLEAVDMDETGYLLYCKNNKNGWDIRLKVPFSDICSGTPLDVFTKDSDQVKTVNAVCDKGGIFDFYPYQIQIDGHMVLNR